ncbi:MAG: FG-GAP-like repeat-containing protein [Bacteroidota bacterium]
MKQLFTLLLFITLNVSAQYFTKVTTGPQSNDGGDSRSVNWIDYDNDNDLDLFISNGPSAKANNFLYKNNGDGTFTKITDASIVNDPGSYDGSTWADYDNDGYIDAFTATWYGQQNSLHRQRNGKFEEVFPRDISKDFTHSETASWGDYDNDGYVDLYLANSAVHLANILYHNNGDGTFTEVKTGAIVTDEAPTRSVDWCDFDNDGDLDLFVANEGGANEALYWNNGNGTFTAETSGSIVSDGGKSFGSSVADIDNDGDFDILVVNNSNESEFLYRNNGNKTFSKDTSDIVVKSSGYSVGSAFGDLDNDGDLDLMVTNAFSGASATKNFLFLNNGNGTFIKVDTGIVSTDLGWSYGVAFGDYDRDGDLDIATGNCFGANQNNALYRNEGNGNKWLTIKAVGKVSNFSAIGTKVKVKTTINGKTFWQVRQVAGQSGYCGQNLESHFGLGNATVIDSLVVEFPSGQKIVQTNIAPNQFMVIKENLPAGYFRGAMQIGNFEDTDPVTIQFKDISNTDPTQPATSWKWDLNGDNVIDATTATTSFTYTIPDSYSILLIVSNGVKTDTLRSNDAIIISPATAIIQFNTTTHNFGIVDVNTPIKDTTMYIYNKGKLNDSISISLVYGATSAQTIKPDSAVKISPTSFVLAANDSQAIIYAVYPPKVNRTNLNITYTPKIVITSKNNPSVKIFEKSMWIKLQGTLLSIQKGMEMPMEYFLEQNYPNPFNPTTKIGFTLQVSGFTSLKIYDAIGREVAVLANEFLEANIHHQRTFQADALSSGVYFAKLQNGDRSLLRKLTLIK